MVRKKKKKKDAETRALKRKLLTYAQVANKTQAVCNQYIRLRDKGKPCISCGRHHKGQYHAGHYISRGSRQELRFHPANIHAQCAPCNNHLSGNIVEYRKGLIEKVGLEMVEYLENYRSNYRPTMEELEEIRRHYKEEIKNLKKDYEKLCKTNE